MRIIPLLIVIALFYSCSSNEKKVIKEASDTIELDQTIAILDKLNKGIQEDSLNPDLFHERALYYFDNNEISAALNDIRKAIRMDSTYAEYHVTISDIYLKMGNLKSCAESLDKAVFLDSKNKDAYLKLAEISIVIRDYDKALKYIDQVFIIDELESRGFFLRGIVKLETGDTIKGIRNFQKAIDVNQDFFDAHLQLGMLYLEKKNKLALDYFNNALNIDPTNLEVIYYIGMYYQSNGEYDKAIQKYNFILDQDAGYFYATYNIGYVNLVYLKEFDVAIDYFSRTIEIEPAYTDAWYNRGFSYELKEDLKNARTDYKKTLELDPNHEKALDGLNRLDEIEK
jgi:tetratricopeptide (TPR) repeat protein